MDLKVHGNYGDNWPALSLLWIGFECTSVRLVQPLCSAASSHPIRHTSHSLSADLCEKGWRGWKVKPERTCLRFHNCLVLFSKSVELKWPCFLHMTIVVTLKIMELRGGLWPLPIAKHPWIHFAGGQSCDSLRLSHKYCMGWHQRMRLTGRKPCCH